MSKPTNLAANSVSGIPTRLETRSWLVWLIAALVFFPSLSSTRLWDEDEGFYAGAALEMFQRNDWVVPYFNGEMFGHKPPWMYWLMMIGYTIFGVGELGARFFSACFACLTVFLTFRLGSRLFNSRVGWIGAMVLGTSLMFTVAGRSATPDVYLVCFTVFALHLSSGGVIVREEPESAARQASGLEQVSPESFGWFRMISIYVLLGLGLLTKGPIAVLFPLTIMVLSLALWRFKNSATRESESRIRSWAGAIRALGACLCKSIYQLRPLTAGLVLLLVAGPWYVLVGWETDWKFHQEFFGVHHFQRATRSMEGHRGSLLYYPASILLGMYPWTVTTVPVLLYWIRSLLKSERDKNIKQNSQSQWQPSLLTLAGSRQSPVGQVASPGFGKQLLTIWILVYLLVFSLAATKLPNYILPAYPALALVFAVVFDAWLAAPKSMSSIWAGGSMAVLTLIGVLIAATVPVMASVTIQGETLFDRLELADKVQDQLRWLGILGLPAALGGVLAMVSLARSQFEWAFQIFLVIALLTVLTFWNAIAPRLSSLQNPQQLIQGLGQNATESRPPLAAFDYFRPSMVFYHRAPVTKCYTGEQVDTFFSKFPSGMMVLDSSRLEELKSSSKVSLEIVERANRFPDKGELIVVAKQTISLVR